MHAYDEAYEPFIFLLSLLGSLPCLDGKKPNQCNVLIMPSQRFGDLKKKPQNNKQRTYQMSGEQPYAHCICSLVCACEAGAPSVSTPELSRRQTYVK